MPRSDDLLAGRYRLVERRGRGGMAEVWAAHDEQLDRRVAVKVMAAHLLDDPKALDRFRREGRAVAQLNHPNVVALHDAASDGDTHFLVMELVDGTSLAERLRAGPLPLDQVLDVGDQVAAGLAAAHERGVVHRDVKPGNILFTGDGMVKVADFGIARAVAVTATTQSVHGSVPYLAPEQAGGATPDPRSDLYALGCVLFEATTGRPPFDGDTAAAMISQHMYATPPVASTLRDEAGPSLDAVISRLLAKDPEARHASAAELRDDLVRVRAGEPPLDADPDGVGDRGASPAGPVGAAAAGAVLAGDGGATPAGTDEPTEAMAPGEPTEAMAPGELTEVVDAVGAAGTARLPDGATERLAGATAASGTGRDRRRWAWLVVAAAAVVAAAVLASGALDDDTTPGDGATTTPTGDASTASAPAVAPTTGPPATPTPETTPSAPGPTTTPTETTAPTPTATPEPTATLEDPGPTSPAPETPEEAIAALRNLVVDGRDNGQLSGEAADALDQRIDEVATRLQGDEDDRDEQVRQEVDELRDELAVQVEQDRANPGIANQLSAAIDDLESTLPAGQSDDDSNG